MFNSNIPHSNIGGDSQTRLLDPKLSSRWLDNKNAELNDQNTSKRPTCEDDDCDPQGIVAGRLLQQNTAPCPRCGSCLSVITSAPPPHHAKQTCGNCKKFIAWIASPGSIERQQELSDRISRLASASLVGWDAQFVKSLVAQQPKKLSPKQFEQLERIERDLGLKGGEGDA